jgi:hypothetical protein
MQYTVPNWWFSLNSLNTKYSQAPEQLADRTLPAMPDPASEAQGGH